VLAITDAYKLWIMQQKAAAINAQPSIVIGLFTNNIVPSRTTLITNLVEATFPGYTRVLGPIVFGAPYFNAGQFAQIDRTTLAVFTPSSVGVGQLVYGYFVYFVGLSILLWAELNAAGPQLIGNSLLPYVVQVSMQESQFNPTGP
jgi:hypothetical protein